MEVVKELDDIEHLALGDYKGPSKYEMEFIIGPVANAGLSKMHAAMHTALHHHMGRGHMDRHCCAPSFDPGIRLRSRSLRDSLVYGTRKVRAKGLKVDEAIRMMQVNYRSRSIRDSLVYGTRTKQCRHKHCTAWDHQHEWNIELEKWDIPLSMLKNEKRKTLWFDARQSVLDQEMIRRKSIPRNLYGELETDGGLYCGYYLPEVILKPWHQGGHLHNFYRHTRDIRPNDWMGDPDWYDPQPEKIEYHKRKVKDLQNWQHRQKLLGDVRYMFARIAEARRQRRHFQRLKLRLKKKKMLWTELNRNSLWFNPWPEGDQKPELVHRSLMKISKRLSTCAQMWNPMFVDLATCEFYLNHLDELCPTVWDKFHYKCKLHKHTNLLERRATLVALMAASNSPTVKEEKIELPPLCQPVVALEQYRKQWAEVKQVWLDILAARPPPPKIVELVEERGKNNNLKETVVAELAKEKEKFTKDKKEAMKVKKGGETPIQKNDANMLDAKAMKALQGEKGAEDKKGVPDSSLKYPQDKKAEMFIVVGGQANDDKKAVEAIEWKAPIVKRKKSAEIEPPPLPAQMTFLHKGEGRQSMVKPSPTQEVLKALERLNQPEAQEQVALEQIVEYIPFKFPLRKQRVRWSILGGKVPILPPIGEKPLLSKESKISALDILDLDKFEAKLVNVKPKFPEKKAREKPLIRT